MSGCSDYVCRTNGPVAISYLADLLDVPLKDYAFGTSGGGGTGGATINNTYSEAGAKLLSGSPVPSVHDQIFLNYTANGSPENINNAMQFIWTGQNDLMLHADWFFDWDPKNTDYAGNMSDRIRYNAEHLIDMGAPYVFIANIYPKHRAPVGYEFLCGGQDCTPILSTLGTIISNANTAIEGALNSSRHADKFIYYDMFGYMNYLMDNKDQYGFTGDLTELCDGGPGNPKTVWDQCAAGGNWEGAKVRTTLAQTDVLS